ncbi:MAG: hypothetical protein COA57_04700 [Flavobacteriales bacterium]|nr:MAG: hypothetical protein COA57_04700 [Flavobacteriales bacterium]
MSEVKEKWNQVLQIIEAQFGMNPDLQSVLFLIGVQELGKGPRDFSKDQKLDVMHIAICKLLSAYGHYEFMGNDEDGWPHWKRNQKLPPLSATEQEQLMKEAAIAYFEETSALL